MIATIFSLGLEYQRLVIADLPTEPCSVPNEEEI